MTSKTNYYDRDICVRYHPSYWYHKSFEWTINRRTILKLVNFVTTSPSLPYLVNNMHEECLLSRLDIILPYPLYTVIPTLQTCRIVYYILLYKPKSVALCFRLDQLIANYCGRRNMAKFTSRFPRLRIPFNPTVG